MLFDAAHAFGARTGGVAIGGFGEAEVFSLTPTKVLVAGEGGLVATRDDALAARLAHRPRLRQPRRLRHAVPGSQRAHVGVPRRDGARVTRRARRHARRRRQLAAVYRRCLDEVPGISFQAVPITDESTFKDFTITVDEQDFGMTRDQLVAVLTAEGVDTRNYFDPPLHLHRAFDGEQTCDLSSVEAISRSVTSLPIYPDLAVSTVEAIVEILLAAHENAEQVSAEVTEAARLDRPQRCTSGADLVVHLRPGPG